jgi:6-phosphogluconate dehydrogenase (decarboxylating)
MQTAMIGLGRMGGKMCRRLMKAGDDLGAAAALEAAASASVITGALSARFRSREETAFGAKKQSAMRFGFGGHVEGTGPIDTKPKAAETRHAAK